MTIAFAAPVIPDLLGTSPADLLRADAEHHDSTLEEARQRAERLRAGIVRYAEMRQDIADAYACRDWLALDYPNWAAYVAGEFGEQLAQLGRGERRQAVADLREQGMSTRQIADATGMPQSTVSDAVRQLTESGQLSQPDRITGSDGKDRPAARPPRTPGPTGAERRPPADPGVTPAPAAESTTAPAVPPQEPDPEPVAAPSTAPTGLGPDLSAGILRALGEAAHGLTAGDIAPRLGRVVTIGDVQAALERLADEGRVDPAGRALQGNRMVPLWMLAELACVGEQYKTDPAERITAVAEVAPEFVKPVEAPAGSPAAWSPAEEAANQLEIQRKQAIESGRRHARTIVTDLRAEVLSIIGAVELGETQLITEEIIADLRAAVDLLASRLVVTA